MKPWAKIVWKIVRVVFPYVLILVIALLAGSEIKEFYTVGRHILHYIAYACFVLVACTALVLAWMTWLYRRLKKKMDLLLEEKEERLFVLRYQTGIANEQKDGPVNPQCVDDDS